MQSNSHSGRRLVVFILVFATIVDLICPFLSENVNVLGIGKSFFVLGVLFVLQYNFRVVRIIFISLLVLASMIWIFQMITNPGVHLRPGQLFPVSVAPLYIYLILLSFFVWMFLRRHNISRTS